jgi:hypothetical protein
VAAWWAGIAWATTGKATPASEINISSDKRTRRMVATDECKHGACP